MQNAPLLYYELQIGRRQRGRSEETTEVLCVLLGKSETMQTEGTLSNNAICNKSSRTSGGQEMRGEALFDLPKLCSPLILGLLYRINLADRAPNRNTSLLSSQKCRSQESAGFVSQENEYGDAVPFI